MALKGLSNVRKAMSEIDNHLNNQLRGIFLQGLGNIAAGTPIDEGRARSNFFLKVGSPSQKVTNSKTGNTHLEKMPKRVLGKKLFYANNLPYINKLEYGGYTGTGPKTINGFSDQAPSGWVRSELLIMRKAIRSIK